MTLCKARLETRDIQPRTPKMAGKLVQEGVLLQVSAGLGVWLSCRDPPSMEEPWVGHPQQGRSSLRNTRQLAQHIKVTSFLKFLGFLCFWRHGFSV